MAKSSQSVESLIKTTFAIQVAVRCTEEAEATCRKNHLRFSEILKPFCTLSNNTQLKDVQGHLYNLKNVRVQFSEAPTEPAPESKLRMLLGEVVQNTMSHPDGKMGMVHIGNIAALASTPWYDAYRDTYLDFLKQSEHETIKHFISVILVVSSMSKDPLEDFSQLYTKQKQSEQSKYPKWLSPHIYYYHVLLHDVVDGAIDVARARGNFDQVKGKYGEGSCYMLHVNSCVPSPSSRPKGGPNVWSQYLKTSADTGGVGQIVLSRGSISESDLKKKNSNVTPNNAHPEENLNMKPDQIREEPQLINPDPSNSDMNVSMDVQPGDDPLSQLAAKSGVPKDEAPTTISKNPRPITIL